MYNSNEALIFLVAIIIFALVGYLYYIEKINKNYDNIEQIEHDKKMELMDCELSIKNDIASVKIDKDTYEIYRKELDAMITFYATTHIDELFGAYFRDNKAIYANVTNEDILDIIAKVGAEIMEDISIHMRQFLYTYFGRMWIQKYIKTKTLSTSLQYIEQKKLTMQELEE
jgi:hypothetical protein